MKKHLLIASLLLVGALAYGQTSSQVMYGVKAGANLAWLTENNEKFQFVDGDFRFDGEFPGKNKWSFYAGVFMEYKINDYIALQPEIVYSRQGSYHHVEVDRTNIDGFKYDKKTHFRLNYINVPVMFRYFPISRFSIDFGPQFGFTVSSVYKSVKTVYFGEGNPINRQKEESKNDEDNAYSFDFSLAMGATLAITERFDFNARFNLGLTNTVKQAGNAKMRNRVVQAGLGYKF